MRLWTPLQAYRPHIICRLLRFVTVYSWIIFTSRETYCTNLPYLVPSSHVDFPSTSEIMSAHSDWTWSFVVNFLKWDLKLIYCIYFILNVWKFGGGLQNSPPMAKSPPPSQRPQQSSAHTLTHSWLPYMDEVTSLTGGPVVMYLFTFYCPDNMFGMWSMEMEAAASTADAFSRNSESRQTMLMVRRPEGVRF